LVNPLVFVALGVELLKSTKIVRSAIVMSLVVTTHRKLPPHPQQNTTTMNEWYNKNINHNRGHNSVSMSSSLTLLCRFLNLVLITLLIVNNNSSSIIEALHQNDLQQKQKPYRCITTCCRSVFRRLVYYKYMVHDDDRTGAWLVPAPKQCDVLLHKKKQCSVNHYGDMMALYMSSNSDDKNGEADVVFDISAKEGVVWYDISQIAGVKETFSDVSVQAGESISSIKRKIKVEGGEWFQNVATPMINLYESINSTEKLDARTKWNSNVKWGTEEEPLVVKLSIASQGILIFRLLCFYQMELLVLTHVNIYQSKISIL
jgi:hypothetical protein